MKRRITPRARYHLDWIGQTYGIGKGLNEWGNWIAHSPHPRDLRQSEVSLEKILASAEGRLDDPLPSSNFEFTKHKFAAASLSEKLSMLRTALTERAMPNQIRACVKEFRGFSDGMLPVEVTATYEIDFSTQSVTFVQFASSSPVMVNVADPANRSMEW
jgi:hypothetical protein